MTGSLLKAQNKPRNLLLALDDCMFEKGLMRNEEMRDIMMNGRHYNLTFINCAQYCMDLSPDARANIDYIFIFKENIIDNRRKLWKYFFGMVDYNLFSEILDRCTGNYQCLVLDTTASTNDINNCVYYYKSNIKTVPERFMMGRRIFYELDRRHARQTPFSNRVHLPEPTALKHTYQYIEKEDDEEDDRTSRIVLEHNQNIPYQRFNPYRNNPYQNNNPYRSTPYQQPIYSARMQ